MAERKPADRHDEDPYEWNDAPPDHKRDHLEELATADIVNSARSTA
jgi:hypothetical protein